MPNTNTFHASQKCSKAECCGWLMFVGVGQFVDVGNLRRVRWEKGRRHSCLVVACASHRDCVSVWILLNFGINIKFVRITIQFLSCLSKSYLIDRGPFRVFCYCLTLDCFSLTYILCLLQNLPLFLRVRLALQVKRQKQRDVGDRDFKNPSPK